MNAGVLCLGSAWEVLGSAFLVLLPILHDSGAVWLDWETSNKLVRLGTCWLKAIVAHLQHGPWAKTTISCNLCIFMQYRLCRISQTHKAWSSGKSAHVVFAECTVCKGSGSCQEGASLREVGRRIPKRNLFQCETTWPLFSFASDVECERLGSTRWWRWPRKRWRGRERLWVANRFSMLYRAQTKKNVEALGESKGWRSTSDWAPWQHLASGNIWQSFRIIPGSTCLCPTIEGGAGGNWEDDLNWAHQGASSNSGGRNDARDPSEIWIDPPSLQICSFLVDAKLIELGWSCHPTSHRVILYKSYHLTLREGVAPLPDEFLDPIHAGPPSQWWKSALAQYPQGLNAEETGLSCELTLQPAWNSSYVVYFCLTQHWVARTPKSQWTKIVIWLKLVETYISWTCPLIALIAWLGVHVFQSSTDMWQFEAGSHAEASGCWHGGG